MTDGVPRDSRSIRWAGVGLAVSGFMLVVTITLYGAVLGGPVASEPGAAVTVVDKANHLAENWNLASALWVTEVALFVLMAVSSLVLVAEGSGGAPWLPRRVAWSTVAVGSILQAAMYAFMLGGYPAAIGVVQTTPALFEVLNGAAFFLFFAGNTTIFLGFAAAYVTEGVADGIVSRRVGWIGGGVCALGLSLLLAVAAGAVSIIAAAPLALLAHIFMGYFGVRLYRRASAFMPAN